MMGQEGRGYPDHEESDWTFKYTERNDFQRLGIAANLSDTFLFPTDGQWYEIPMKHRWRSGDAKRNRSESSFHNRGQRSRSPSGQYSEAPPHHRRGGDKTRGFPHPRREREYPPEERQYQSRPPPPFPRRGAKHSTFHRNRFEEDWTHSSRDSSPPRFAKRRRTRSPSSGQEEIPFVQSHTDNRSRSQDRYDFHDNPPLDSQEFSPRGQSPIRLSRPASRGTASELDLRPPLGPQRDRSPPTAPRGRPRRSPSPPRRTPSPTYRRQTPSPVPRRFDVSPHDSLRGSPPHHTQYPRSRYLQEQDQQERRHFPVSNTPSEAGDRDRDRDPMEGSYGGRGNHANPNHIMRGRGGRPYNNRGSHRGSPPFSTPNSSHHGSPNSNTSYQGGRGGWDKPPQRGSQYSQGPPHRQNNFPGAGQSQEEYFQSQQQAHGHHPHSNQQHRPYRGGRGGNRGNYYQQQDRRFSGPSSSDHPPPYRGRGGSYNNSQWPPPGPKRGGGPNRPATGANSIQPTQSLSHKGSRASLESQEDMDRGRPGNLDDRGDHSMIDENKDDNGQAKDNSKFSFAFKSKPAPPPPTKPPADLNAKARFPSGPAEHRPPPTQPRAKYQERKNQKHFDRRFEHDGPGRPPPHQPQSHRFQQHPPEPRDRSRSPPSKRQKQEPKQRPQLSVEMAASDSIYFRKPGNESVIGAGTYGKVFKAIHIYTKDMVALKKIRMEGERDGFPITACREIKLLQNLRHKHVVALQEVMVEKNECFMVFEYMSHDLTGLINHPTFKLSPAHKKDLGRQMFEGLEFLHRRGVMHRDIKAANLLVSADGQLKYADFGLARFYTKSRKQDYTNRVITIWYRPPELLLGETQYTPAVDIWSAACVFMEMFTKKAIFPGEGGELSQLQKVYHVLGTPTRTEWPGMVDLPWFELMQPSERRKRVFETNYGSVLSPAALDLVRAIFSYDHLQRPTAEEALKHPYFTDEEPAPQQPYELADVGGDWHEYESKAHRRENDRKEKERKKEEFIREKEKRKAREAGIDSGLSGSDTKKVRSEPESEAGREEPPPPPQDERAEDSDGDGSARMSMS